MRIYKYVLYDPKKDKGFAGRTIDMYQGEILKVDAQRDCVCAWVLADIEKPTVRRRFSICATGEDAPCVAEYRGTVQVMKGLVVLHVFEDLERYTCKEYPNEIYVDAVSLSEACEMLGCDTECKEMCDCDGPIYVPAPQEPTA